jgi:CheY-like chemotaxis protein
VDGKKKRILVVDDEPFLLSMLIDFCEEIGVDTVPAQNGEEALKLVASEPVDMVTIDQRMPGLSGVEVLAKLKSDPKTAGLPVILLSASALLFEKEAKDKGAVGILQKPVKHKELKAMIEKCLGKI